MKDLIIFEEKNNKSEFVVKLSQEIAHVFIIYCETIEIDHEQFIKDAIVKDLIKTYIDLKLSLVYNNNLMFFDMCYLMIYSLVLIFL